MKRALAAVALSAWVVVLAHPVCAQTKAPGAAGKKVYISADIEGISGVSGDDGTSASSPDYGRTRRLMMEDVNAAIRGAVLGGAGEVVVNDSHGGMRNLLPEDLDPAARLISHSFKRHGMMEGLDETYDAVIFIGYHAKADSPVGVFAHTGSGVLRDVQVNGRSLGEGGLNTLYAAWYGVPVVLVTGDDVAVAQTREAAPAARGVVVKRAINTRVVEHRPLAVVRQEITSAAREAVAGAKRFAPQRSGPYRVQMQFRTIFIPEVAEAIPAVQRQAPDTIAFSSDSYPAAYRLFRVLYRYVTAE